MTGLQKKTHVHRAGDSDTAYELFVRLQPRRKKVNKKENEKKREKKLFVHGPPSIMLIPTFA